MKRKCQPFFLLLPEFSKIYFSLNGSGTLKTKLVMWHDQRIRQEKMIKSRSTACLLLPSPTKKCRYSVLIYPQILPQLKIQVSPCRVERARLFFPLSSVCGVAAALAQRCRRRSCPHRMWGSRFFVTDHGPTDWPKAGDAEDSWEGARVVSIFSFLIINLNIESAVCFYQISSYIDQVERQMIRIWQQSR